MCVLVCVFCWVLGGGRVAGRGGLEDEVKSEGRMNDTSSIRPHRFGMFLINAQLKYEWEENWKQYLMGGYGDSLPFKEGN